MMYALLAVVGLLVFAGSFYQYRQTASTMWMILALLGIVATVAFGGLFLSGRVNKKEDIHITE